MKSRELLKILPLALLVLAIGLSPRIPVGILSSGRTVDLRVEDIVLLLFGIYWIFQILKSGINNLGKSPLLFPILAWLGIGLFSTLANLVLLNILQPSRTFFFFLKEIEYFFLFFYVFYHLKSVDAAKILLKIWLLVGSINAFWIIFQLILGLRFTYYYGPTPFIEPEGTFPGGGFFLILFIFLLNVFLYYYLVQPISRLKKIIMLILISSLAVGILSSGSRTSVAGLLAASVASFLIYAIRVNLWRAVLVFSFIVIYVSGIFAVSPPPDKFSYTSPFAVINRIFNIKGIKNNLDPNYPTSRPEIWIYQLREMAKEPLSFIFGFGKGAMLGEKAVGESHSQYVRNFVETGIVGLLVFLFLLYSIFKSSIKEFLSSKNAFLTAVSVGLFCSTIAMVIISLFAEGFLVVKINEAYWFFAALTFAVIYMNKENKINQYA